MTFNLIQSPWLPARRRRSGPVWITPAEIAPGADGDDPIEALAFPRPDWNGHVSEFLIGLIKLGMNPKGPRGWRAGWTDPPSAADLAARLAPFVSAFNGDGPGPLAFQDLDLLEGIKDSPIEELLIDGPGDNGKELNTDFFVKRGRTPALSLPFAYAALITHQTCAPEGGQGYWVSMRGGGPMTTLVDPPQATTLWHKLWANVLPSQSGPADWGLDDPRTRLILPWLAPTIVCDKTRGIGPSHETCDWLPYFACPTRIRLLVGKEGVCALNVHAYPGVVEKYRKKKNGARYANWKHPLSPHTAVNDNSTPAPVRPNPSNRGYRGWASILGLHQGRYKEAAIPIQQWPARAKEIGLDPHLPSVVHAFGFDMKKNKPRAWVDARIPIHLVEADQEESWLTGLEISIAGAAKANSELRQAIFRARIGEWKTNNQNARIDLEIPKKKKKSEAERGQDAQLAFWTETEKHFLDWLENFRCDVFDREYKLRHQWKRILEDATLDLFDRYAGVPDDPGLSAATLAKIAVARDDLRFAFDDHPKAGVTMALKLPVSAKPPSNRKPKGKGQP